MGLGADITRFFAGVNARNEGGILQPYSMSDFYDEHKNHLESMMVIPGICQKLVLRHVLTYVGRNLSENRLFMGDMYYCLSFNEGVANYGSYDFLAFGAPHIRGHFLHSVLPIIVEKNDGTQDIGTGFLVEGGRIVTARHCVEAMKTISVPGCSEAPSRVFALSGGNDDVAVIDFSVNPFPQYPKFQMRKHFALEEVITMGYPPIPGFDMLLVTEKSHLAADLKSSKGAIVAEGMTYLYGEDYILMNARVKGGNSGGPVIGEDGKVIGLISEIPSTENGLDALGYGVVTPISKVQELLSSQEVDVDNLEFNWRSLPS